MGILVKDRPWTMLNSSTHCLPARRYLVASWSSLGNILTSFYAQRPSPDLFSCFPVVTKVSINRCILHGICVVILKFQVLVQFIKIGFTPVVYAFIYSTHIYFIMYIMHNQRSSAKQINTISACVCRAQFCGDCPKHMCFTWWL